MKMEAALSLSMAIKVLTDPLCLFWTFLGTFMGLIFGALPGLTATMGVALLVPLTFSFPPVRALSMMLGVYCGGIAGGAVSAVLLNIPGTPSAVMTTIDGYPMAKQGRAAQALGWAATASFFGGAISWLILVTVAPQIARYALRFGPPEYAALALFGLMIISSISGKSLLKGIISGLIGVWLSFFGVDPIMGDLRFTFGSINLMSGIAIMPALIGFYALPQILRGVSENEIVDVNGTGLKSSRIIPSLAEVWRSKSNIVRSSLIGTLIGMIPATGGNIAAFLAYDQAKRFAKKPEEFGQGTHEGVIASEAANNGVTGGALIPLLTLGIPGDSVTAVLLGGLMIHGLQPGPELFVRSPDVVMGMFTMLIIANVFMTVIQFFGIKFFVQVLKVPNYYLAPVLLVLSIVGSYALRNSLFDVWITMFLGLFGFIMSRGGFPMAPTVLGLVLGPILESEMRRSLILSGGRWSIFFVRPISALLIALSAFTCLAVAIRAANKETKHDEIEVSI
jgi:putative tricarboxylic transport membrane protein